MDRGWSTNLIPSYGDVSGIRSGVLFRRVLLQRSSFVSFTNQRPNAETPVAVLEWLLGSRYPAIPTNIFASANSSIIEKEGLRMTILKQHLIKLPCAPRDQRTASIYIFGAVCPKDGTTRRFDRCLAASVKTN